MNRTRLAVIAALLITPVILVRCSQGDKTVPVSPSPAAGQAQTEATASPIPSPEPAQAPLSTAELIRQARECNPERNNCNRALGEALDAVLIDYQIDRVNHAIIAARALAVEQGIQPIDVLRQWQRKLAQDFAWEIQHGTGENSRKVRQDLIQRFQYAMLAESVIAQGQPMQAINQPENAIACALQNRVGFAGVNCNDR